MKSKKYPIGTGGGRHPERIERKRAEAIARTLAWQSLHKREQLASLDARLGRGVGARRQREKLAQALS